MNSVFYFTGGGFNFLDKQMSGGGASSFVQEVKIPYSRNAIDELLEHKPPKYCSEKAASQLAVRAYYQAVKLRHSTNVLGVGMSCQLKKKDDERNGRKNVAYIAIHSENRTLYAFADLSTIKTRQQQEHMLSNVISQTYNSFLREEYLSHGPISVDIQYDHGIRPQFNYYCMNEVGNPYNSPSTIFPGTFFDGVSDSQLKLIKSAYRATGGKRVWLEISINSIDRPRKDWVEVKRAIKAILYCSQHHSEIAGACISFSKMFGDKSREYYEPTFLTGDKTIRRIFDRKHYYNDNHYICCINDAAYARFIVGVRDSLDLSDLPLNIQHRTIKVNI
jgi:hypothetical protein